MTPNDIEILIHCYCCPEPHERLDALAVREAITQMMLDGLIYQKDERRYRTTDRGVAHIRQLCDLPLPQPAWKNAHGEIIRDE